jgi:FMN phosphatase YigB (HAD superfamily)
MVNMLKRCALEDVRIGEQPVITHIFHFGGNPKSRIPAGDLSTFKGRYLDLGDIRDFHAMAVRSSELVSEILGLPQRPPASLQSSPVRSPVVFFDLDATLFDYTDLRKRATAAAVEGLVADPDSISAQLLDLLRPPFTDVLVHLGLPDLRREWDSPEVLALAEILENSTARNDFFAIADASRHLNGNEDSISFSYRLKCYKLAQELRRSAAAGALLDAISAAKDRSGNSPAEKRQVFKTFVQANANLATGAERILSNLITAGADVHVVSEGDSAIQMFKLQSLGLTELVHACVITDMTCGTAGILTELFLAYADSEVPPAVESLYDQLAPYSVKSTAFFSKLLHAVVEQRPGSSLQDRIQSPKFLTADEWETTQPTSVVMVGDRYRKDLEPLLQVCPVGSRAYRVLSGRYYREDPLYELIEQNRPLPHGIFRDIQALEVLLKAIVNERLEPIRRPLPALPSLETLDEVLRIFTGLSHSARAVLDNIRSEVLRHKGES